MKNSTEEIDQIIKESLTKEEAQFYDDLDEQNLIQMFEDLFKTKQSWLIIIMNIVNLIAFVVFVYCLVQFINTYTVGFSRRTVLVNNDNDKGVFLDANG